MHARIADGDRVDTQIEPGRRPALHAVARQGEHDGLVRSAQPPDRWVVGALRRGPVPAIGRAAIVLLRLRFGHHHVDARDVASLDEKRPGGDRKHVSRSRQDLDAGVDFGKRRRELLGRQHGWGAVGRGG